MKILHLSTTDTKGGAGIAAFRLHSSLCKEGLSSMMAVQRKFSSDDEVITSNRVKGFLLLLMILLERLPAFLVRECWNEKCSTGLVGTFDARSIRRIEPDIVHLHWFNSGFISLKQLRKINLPTVWTLHDVWALRSLFHYDNGGWWARLIFSWLKRKKLRLWATKNITFVAPSEWLAQQIKAVLPSAVVHCIHHGIDTKIFKVRDKKAAKKELGLDQYERIILVGAVDLTEDRKGYGLLLKALQDLRVREKTLLLTFGKNPLVSALPMPIKSIGLVNEEDRLSLIYSAADVMCVPSKQEAFGLTALEAQACGTAVVAFNATGVKDIVKHGHTGYLAEPYSTDDFKNGIYHCLNNSYKYGQAARKMVEEHFSISSMTNRYLVLYSSLLNQ